MNTDSPPIDAQAYNSLVNRAVLRSIRLTRSQFDIQPEALEVDTERWRKDINVEVQEVISSPETGMLAGSFVFNVTCRHRRKKIFSVNTVYFITFKTTGEYEEDSASLFIERIGRVAAYPYFRSIVADLASQSGIRMPPLPIISLAPRTVSSAKDLIENHPVKGLHEVE